jgi:hypothetical protein
VEVEEQLFSVYVPRGENLRAEQVNCLLQRGVGVEEQLFSVYAPRGENLRAEQVNCLLQCGGGGGTSCLVFTYHAVRTSRLSR